MTIADNYKQAELALAAYGNLAIGTPDIQALKSKDVGMSSTQAAKFAETYSVITQYNDTLAEGGLGTSFSATVFKDGSGKLTLAIRGTAELTGSPNDLTTDASILAGGAGYDQIVALYNWWSRSIAAPGTPVQQYRLVSSSTDPQAVQVGSQWLERAGTVSATGGDIYNAVAADADHKLEVTGHSLGGHLAMAFSTLFAGFTTQATVFNAPGFKDNATNQAFFAALGGTVPTGGAITNVIADEAKIGDNPWSAIAGLNSRPGTAVDVAIENQFGSDEPDTPAAKNHSQQTLTDALAVYALLRKLDSTLSDDSYKSILNVAAAGTSAGLERIVDAIEKLFGINSDLMLSGNNNRDLLYQAIYGAQDNPAFKSLIGKASIVSFTSTTSASGLINKANQDDAEGLAYRYALTALNPFVVLGADYSAHNTGGALELENPTTNTGEITAQYLKDRSEFLVRKTWFNTQDIAPVNPGYQFNSTNNIYQQDNTLFIDAGSGYKIAQGFDPASPFANIHRYYFGDEKNNTYTGGDFSDYLYSGGGNDTLNGGFGDDYLEGNEDHDVLLGGEGADTLYGGQGDDVLDGGAGIDIYLFKRGDGIETLPDDFVAPGVSMSGEDKEHDKIVINGKPISGGGADRWSVNMWVDGQNDLTYIWTPLNEGVGRLSIYYGYFGKDHYKDCVTIENFYSGSYGIGLTQKYLHPRISWDEYLASKGEDEDEEYKKWREKNKRNGELRYMPPAVSDGFNHAQQAVLRRDPLILDLDRDGLEIVGASEAGSVFFDHDGDGVMTKSGWVKPDDGLLVFDRNGNGLIDNGGELFGDSTRKQDGTLAKDGFDALADLDSNGDGKIDALDDQFANLRVWRDLNSDGISQGEELQTLEQAGIQSFYVNKIANNQVFANGNRIADLGYYTRTDGLIATLGEVGSMADVDLSEDTFHRQFTDIIPVPDALAGLPDMTGSGALRDLLEAAALSPDLAGALQTYAMASTREEQQAQLKGVLVAWAGSASGFKTSRQSAQESEREVIFQFSDNQSVTYANGQWVGSDDSLGTMDMFATLEAFNGKSFVDFTAGANNGGTQLSTYDSGDIHRTTVVINWMQMDFMGRAWSALQDSVYSTLVMQTRLKPYVEGVVASVDNSGIHLDVNSTVALLEQVRQIDPHKYIADFVELRRYAEGVWVNAEQYCWQTFNTFALQYAQQPEGAAYLANLGVRIANGILSDNANGNILLGQSSNDTIYGGSGNDVLSGGGGSDVLAGGGGADIYQFGRGDGSDFIDDQGTDPSGINSDIIQFGENITAADVTISRINNDLILYVKGTDDQLRVSGYFFKDGLSNHGLEIIQFSDGESWDFSTIKTMALASTGGNDLLIGYASNDHVSGGDGNDSLIGNAGADLLEGGNDNDFLRGDAGADTLDGGAGNDTLLGGDGADVYLFGRGSGHDLINNTDLDAYGTNADTLLFGADITTTDISLSRFGNDLILYINGTNDQIDVMSYFNQDGVSAYGLEKIQFADGTIWDVSTIQTMALASTCGNDSLMGYASDDSLSGGAGSDSLFGNNGADTLDGEEGNDALLGGAGNDMLRGGAGNDTLDGGEGNDIYIYSVGDGNDFIWNSDSSGNKLDTLQFDAGISPQDITVIRSGDDITLRLSTQDSVTIGGFFLSDGTSPRHIEQVRFDGGAIWTWTDLLLAMLNGNDQSNTIHGYASNDTLSGGQGNDQLFGGAGNDRLTGDDGNDWLDGGDGQDTLDGGTDADQLRGGAGNDTYLVGENSDSDWILDTGGQDTLALSAGVLPEQIALYRYGNNLVIGLTNNPSFQVVIEDHFASTTKALEQITFANGTLWNAATITSKTVAGTPNILIGTTGNDIFIVDSVDDVVSEAANQGIDTVQTIFNYVLGANLENLTLTGVLSVNGTGNELNNVIHGNSANNILDGLAGQDTLYGGAGDDTLYIKPSEGDVAIEYANEGNDTLYVDNSYTLLDNIENLTTYGGYVGTITATGNSLNNVITGRGIASTDIFDGGLGADTMISPGGGGYFYVDNAGDKIVTPAWGNGADNVISSIDWVLGDSLENIELKSGSGAISGTGNALANKLTGNQNDNVLSGLDGNDFLYSGQGADTLAGGKGNDFYFLAETTNGSYDGRYYHQNSTAQCDDQIVEGADEGVDTVGSLFDYTLTDNVENLWLGTYKANDFSWAPVMYPVYGGGNALNNVISGNQGANILDGKEGADTFQGNGGDDTYYVDNVLDVVQEYTNDGTDSVISTVSYALSANVENLTLVGLDAVQGIGNAQNNRLDGSQSMAANILVGGQGDDTYVLGDGDIAIEVGGEGIDTIVTTENYSLGQDFENLTLTGVAATTGTGTDGNNVLDGSENAAANILIGGLGDDSYVVGNNDIIVELENEGADTVIASGSYTLGANLENLTLLNGDSGTGNDLNNVITGAQDKDNILNGGAGIDRLIGGWANDTYVIDNAGDTVENETGGIDTVNSYISYTLTPDLENLVLLGAANTNGTGNDLDNRLEGNSGANILTGGLGNDTYVVDSLDQVVESANQGTDTVVSNGNYTLGANIENLTLVGNSAINGTGNTANNILTGNSASNVLDGGAGADTLKGGAGDDTYIIDNTSDVITENVGEGIDTAQSTVTYTLGNNVENLTLAGITAINGTGNSLDNVLRGNAAANVLKGGAGNDTYYVGTGDTVTESASQGTDTVIADITWTLGSNLENLILSGTSAINGIGNTLNNTLTGNSAANTLSGGTGADTMIGGLGDDTYVVDRISDVVAENANEGIDLVQSNVTYTLSANVENLTLTGTKAINGTGNTLDNVLMGNSAVNTLTGGAGNDTLDGGAGADKLLGGAGNDTYIVDNTKDVITENANEGTDSVQSSVTYTLGSTVENLTLTGTTAINGTGNTLDNVLTGNSAVNTLTGGAGNDTLDGGAGADKLLGGAGNDTYIVDNTKDVITENANEGTDSVQSSVTYTLGSNIENLALMGTAAINGTGNALNNVLTGNSGNNMLTGAAGNDSLNGGAGADTLAGGVGNDTYVLGRGYGSDTISETDATAGNTDVAQFGADVTNNQLWFSHVGNNLEVSIIGTSDKFTIQNWYAGSQYHVEQFKSGDGKVLLDTQVNNLVNAMAAFTPPAAGQTTLPQATQDQLQPVLAANWH